MKNINFYYLVSVKIIFGHMFHLSDSNAVIATTPCERALVAFNIFLEKIFYCNED